MKARDDKLLEEIGSDLCQYLKAGMEPDSFSQKIDHSLNIEDLDKLLRIHFVLTETQDGRLGVIDFVKNLTSRIRRFKTTIEKERKRLRGEVRGRIDWQSTYKSRYKENPEDKQTFVCSQQEKNYNTAENLVLKRLLEVIHKTVYKVLKTPFEDEYEWLGEWTEKNNKLQKVLKQVFQRNIYIRRTELADINITDRMIVRTMKSRQPLYREAAELLSRYRKLMNHDIDDGEAKELLKNTFIKPEKTEVLFELYWIIRIIESLGETENLKFKIIEKGKNQIAGWNMNGFSYKLYHDSTGSFEFREEIGEDACSDCNKNGNEYLQRMAGVIEEHNSAVEELFEKGASNDLWGGRPDIVLEKYKDEEKEPVQVFIGEVKHTDSEGYAIQGLKELLEYMAFIREGEDYFHGDRDTIFKGNPDIEGLLLTGNLGTDIDGGSDEKKNYSLIQYGEDSDDKLSEVLAENI